MEQRAQRAHALRHVNGSSVGILVHGWLAVAGCPVAIERTSLRPPAGVEIIGAAKAVSPILGRVAGIFVAICVSKKTIVFQCMSAGPM